MDLPEEIPAVGIVGVEAFKPEWIPQLEPFQIHLALDNDTAGKSGGERIRQLFHEHDLPVRIVSLPDEYNDINDLVAARGAEAFKQIAAAAELQSPDLVTIVKSLRRRISDHSDDFDLTDLGERIYRWFESNGGMFFCGRNKRTHLLFEKKLYRIGDNDDFNALMMRKARLLSNLRQSRGLWVALHTFCVMEGRRQTTLNWCWADKLKGEVYLNLHNESHQLVRIAPGQVEVCLNGDNPAEVLLGEADKMLPIEYEPDATPREAVDLLKELVIDALACRPPNRLLLTSWLLSAFFLDFAPHKGMMKLSGPTKSGKSTAGQILTTLLYGTAQVENPTVAYSYTDTSRNPLLVCDNMENQQLTLSVIQFLLGVATGASRSKREAGTRDGVVREPVHALVALTAIEPLPKSELINRFYEVEFDKIFKRGGFLPDVHLKRLEAARNRILSGLFQLFSREVLPGFLSSRQTLMHRLEANFPEHSKDRTNSFLTIVVLIMRALVKLLEGLADPDPRTWEILTKLIKEQGEIAEETERETNPATYLLDALAHEVRTKGSGLVDKQYYVQSQAVLDEAGELKEVHLVAPAKDFYLAFVTLSRNRGYAVPFLNAKSLMARINSETEALAASGWRWKREKTVNGYQHHRFVKAMVRAPIEETPEGSPPTGGE